MRVESQIVVANPHEVLMSCQDRPEHTERLELEVPGAAPTPSVPSVPSMLSSVPSTVPVAPMSAPIQSSAPFTEPAPAETGIRKKTRKVRSPRVSISECETRCDHLKGWF